MSSVSREIFRRFTSGRGSSVRMLWRRSASLMRTTRRSSAIATIIFRMFSACCCWSVRIEMRPSLVTPSTSRATSAPNSVSISSAVSAVAATAVLILAGASLNVSGRQGEAAVLAVVGGLFAVAAGALNENWKLSAPAGVAAVLATLDAARFDIRDAQLPFEFGGLLLIAIGGFVGRIAYNNFTDALHHQLEEMESLVTQLEEKQRVFVAATSEAESPVKSGDVGALTSSIAGQMGAAFACFYLASADGKQF